MMPFSDKELLEPVKKSLESILPILKKDGGGLKLIGIKEGKVYVSLIGRCNGCVASGQTLKNVVKRQLNIDIHPELEVVSVGEDFEL